MCEGVAARAPETDIHVADRGEDVTGSLLR